MSAPTGNTIVLITGANQGIGLATTRLLASKPHSYHILLGSRDSKRGSEAAKPLQDEGLSVEPITIDVTDDASIAAAVAEVEKKFGRLDVLVNNAGIVNPPDNGSDKSPRKTWQTILDVNLVGPAMVTDAFTALLNKSSHPRVVFVGTGLSSMSFRNDYRNSYYSVPAEPYRASKAGLNMLAVCYANTVGKEHGWQSNVCCPGHIGTNLNNYSGAGTPEDGAKVIVNLATAGKNGLTGTFQHETGTYPW